MAGLPTFGGSPTPRPVAAPDRCRGSSGVRVGRLLLYGEGPQHGVEQASRHPNVLILSQRSLVEGLRERSAFEGLPRRASLRRPFWCDPSVKTGMDLKTYFQLFWVPAVASAALMAVLWAQDELSERDQLFFAGWFLLALAAQYLGTTTGMLWIVGLTLQTALATFLLLKSKLGDV